MVVTRGRGAHLAALALVALGLTACGSSQSGTTATDTASSSSGLPACASVWTDGATLPRGYGGCVQGDQVVKPDALGCSSGQRIIRYADSYYAVPGGTVHAVTKPLNSDPQYLAAMRRCRA